MSLMEERPAPQKNKVFVRDAREDREFVDELAMYLRPGVRADRLRLFDDSMIPAGARWGEVIEDELLDAAVCVLLVSQYFFDSDFISEHELPRIVERAHENETRLIWIPVRHSTVGTSPLWEFQSARSPSEPISSISPSDREAAWVDIAEQITLATTLNSVSRSLSVLDDTAETFDALVQGRSVDLDQRYSVVAGIDRRADVIEFEGGITTIAYDDLRLLPADDQMFIQDIEASLDRHYGRWRKIRAKIGEAAGALDDEINGELRRVAKLICADLSAILDFLSQIHKYELEDHYGRYRFICSQITS